MAITLVHSSVVGGAERHRSSTSSIATHFSHASHMRKRMQHVTLFNTCMSSKCFCAGLFSLHVSLRLILDYAHCIASQSEGSICQLCSFIGNTDYVDCNSTNPVLYVLCVYAYTSAGHG